MFKLILVFVLFSLHRHFVLSVAINPKSPQKVIYQLEDVNVLFKEFTAKFEKKYNSAELEHRHKVFVDNLILINRWNQEHSDAVFGIGPFADLTFEEFVKTHTGFHGNFTNSNTVKYEPKGTAPESLDWRQQNIVTRVKNQLSCGSCYIFSAIGNIESLYAKKTGQLIELSEQQSLDCNSNGCNGGLPHEVMQALASHGCMKESDYPYEGQQSQCRIDSNKVAVRVNGGNMLSVGSEEDLKDAVANNGPLAIGISTNEEFQHMQGGVFTPKSQCSGSHHAILLIGYGTDGGKPYWLIKNSWGEHWNEAGYLRLIRGQGACDIGSYVASATVA